MTDTIRFDSRSIDGAEFHDCAMARSVFDDVNLADARFTNVDLRRTRFRDVNMAGVSIDDANIDGLTVLGNDVPALIAAQRRSAQAAPGVAAMSAEPQLFVADIDAACRFYIDKLGFCLAFSYGEPAFYAQVARSGARLNLRAVAGPVFDSGFKQREADALSATIALNDVRSLYSEFQDAGIAFHQELRSELWGALTFIVRDPDANLIAFAGNPD